MNISLSQLSKLPKNACPNAGCDLSLSDRERLQNHAETVCQHRKITCPVVTCTQQLEAQNMREHVETHQLPRPGHYGIPMTLSVTMGPLARHESLQITMTEQDGFSELRHFTLCFRTLQPVPSPRANKVPQFQAYVCETGLQDDEESTLEFWMQIESDEGNVLRQGVTSRCLSPGAARPPAIYFTPAGDTAKSKYVKSVVFDIEIRKAGNSEDDIDTDDTDDWTVELMTSDEEEENYETDGTISPFQIGQGIAQAHVQLFIIVSLYHKLLAKYLYLHATLRDCGFVKPSHIVGCILKKIGITIRTIRKVAVETSSSNSVVKFQFNFSICGYRPPSHSALDFCPKNSTEMFEGRILPSLFLDTNPNRSLNRRQNVKMEEPTSSNVIFTFPFMNEQFTRS